MNLRLPIQRGWLTAAHLNLLGVNDNVMARVRRVPAAAGVLLLIVLAVLLGRQDHAPHVRRYLCRPLPLAVREVSFASNDRFGISIEWSAHMAFTAPTGAMEEVIRAGGFHPSSLEFATSTPGRPRQWPSQQQLGTDSRAYFRVHMPRFRHGWLPHLGTNRRWSEVLLVDASGTNAFFTMWDTD